MMMGNVANPAVFFFFFLLSRSQCPRLAQFLFLNPPLKHSPASCSPPVVTAFYTFFQSRKCHDVWMICPRC